MPHRDGSCSAAARSTGGCFALPADHRIAVVAVARTGRRRVGLAANARVQLRDRLGLPRRAHGSDLSDHRTRGRAHHRRLRWPPGGVVERAPRTGSSPRGRGTRKPGYGQPYQYRVIPAWAGNTQAGLWPAVSVPGHPRVGGEHQRDLILSDFLNGSSPRGRGTRRHRLYQERTPTLSFWVDARALILILGAGLCDMTSATQRLQVVALVRIAAVVERLDMVGFIPVRAAGSAPPVCKVKDIEADGFPLPLVDGRFMPKAHVSFLRPSPRGVLARDPSAGHSAGRRPSCRPPRSSAHPSLGGPRRLANRIPAASHFADSR